MSEYLNKKWSNSTSQLFLSLLGWQLGAEELTSVRLGIKHKSVQTHEVFGKIRKD